MQGHRHEAVAVTGVPSAVNGHPGRTRSPPSPGFSSKGLAGLWPVGKSRTFSNPLCEDCGPSTDGSAPS